MIICVKCGHQNPEGPNQCEKCGAQLPKIVSEGNREPEPEFIDDRVRELEDAAAKVTSGEWTVEAYSSFLDGILKKLSDQEQAIREIEIPPETVEDFREELEQGFAGIQLFFEGVTRMTQYAHAQEPAELEEGLALVRKGNGHINEAMKINRRNRKKYEEMYLDSSAMM